MPVVHPSTYRTRAQPKARRRWPIFVLMVLIVIGTVNYIRPLPQAAATLTLPALKTVQQPTIAWPSYGQAAIGAAGYDVLATNGQQTPIATASIAKVITALCVLEKLPLADGQSGPSYTVTQQDVDILNGYIAQNGSLLLVSVGERLTEYQAIQALMIPSANNIADSLVRWVFGSQAAYGAFASSYLTNHGLTNTRIGTDASGLDPGTTSTAGDLTKLGLLAQQSPVLMTIAGQASATFPVAGTVNNYNTVLGVNGITGLKTGNSDANPGAFLFTARARVGDKEITTDGVVLGAPNLDVALQDATKLAASIKNGFEQVTVATAGKQLGTVRTAWGASAPIVTAQTVRLVHWQATQLYQTHTVDTNVRSGTVGKLQVTSGNAKSTANLVLKNSITEPSFWWRLTRH